MYGESALFLLMGHERNGGLTTEPSKERVDQRNKDSWSFSDLSTWTFRINSTHKLHILDDTCYPRESSSLISFVYFLASERLALDKGTSVFLSLALVHLEHPGSLPSTKQSFFDS